MRGTFWIRADDSIHNWFIPACAGNINVVSGGAIQTSVHPRMCGEHIAASLSTSESCGSSPHVRGTCEEIETVHHQCRFIPACAGNMPRRHRHPGGLPVHPRMCGEHAVYQGNKPLPVGSSPHVRGTSRKTRPIITKGRFIPACAGNMPLLLHIETQVSVHPRMCGEHHKT